MGGVKSIKARIEQISLMQFDLQEKYHGGKVAESDFHLINKYLEMYKVELKELLKCGV